MPEKLMRRFVEKYRVGFLEEEDVGNGSVP